MADANTAPAMRLAPLIIVHETCWCCRAAQLMSAPTEVSDAHPTSRN